MARTDTHTLVVANHSTGQRFSYTGNEKDCAAVADEQKKVWKGDKLEVIIQKR